MLVWLMWSSSIQQMLVVCVVSVVSGESSMCVNEMEVIVVDVISGIGTDGADTPERWTYDVS